MICVQFFVKYSAKHGYKLIKKYESTRFACLNESIIYCHLAHGAYPLLFES